MQDDVNIETPSKDKRVEGDTNEDGKKTAYDVLFRGKATQGEGGAFNVEGNEFSITPREDGDENNDSGGGEKEGSKDRPIVDVVGRNGDKRSKEPVSVGADEETIENKADDGEGDATIKETTEDEKARRIQEELIDKLMNGEISAEEWMKRMSEAAEKRGMPPEQFEASVKDQLTQLGYDEAKVENILALFDKNEERIEEAETAEELVENFAEENGISDAERIRDLQEKFDAFMQSRQIDWEQVKKNRRKARAVMYGLDIIEFLLNELKQTAAQTLQESLQGQ